jgi:hypothetical protein
MGKYLNAFVISVITFFSPIYGLLLAVGTMIFMDTILGITKAIKQARILGLLQFVNNK